MCYPHANNDYMRSGWLDCDPSFGHTGIQWADSGRDCTTCLRDADVDFKTPLPFVMPNQDTADETVWEVGKPITIQLNPYMHHWDLYVCLVGEHKLCSQHHRVMSIVLDI